MKQKNSPLCPTCNVVEDNIHMFLKCKNIQNTLESFKLTLSNSCNIQNINLEKLIFLDVKLNTKRQLNTAIILTVHYISTVWYNRCRNTELDPTLFKVNVLNHQRLLSLILKDRQQQVFTDMNCIINIINYMFIK